MQITIDKTKGGYLAFGEGVAFVAPTRTEAAAGAIAEMEKRPEEPEKEYVELTDFIAELHGILNYPDLGVNVVLNLQLRPMAIQSPEGALELQNRLKNKLEKASLGLSAISSAVSDLLMGKKNIIILEKL